MQNWQYYNSATCESICYLEMLQILCGPFTASVALVLMVQTAVVWKTRCLSIYQFRYKLLISLCKKKSLSLPCTFELVWSKLLQKYMDCFKQSQNLSFVTNVLLNSKSQRANFSQTRINSGFKFPKLYQSQLALTVFRLRLSSASHIIKSYESSKECGCAKASSGRMSRHNQTRFTETQ